MKQMDPLFANHPSVVEQRELKDKLVADIQREQNLYEGERLLNAAADHFAATLAQADERAWHQLLVYCPKDVLADFYQ